MKYSIWMLLFFILASFSSSNFSRDEYYKVFQEDSLLNMEHLAAKINGDKSLNAYQGALLMRISGLQKNVKNKLNTFKSGKKLLELAISQSPKNIEWRFLRFMVQENAPPIVKYKLNLEEDKSIIINNFTACDIKLQTTIKNYTSKSSLLQLNDLPQ